MPAAAAALHAPPLKLRCTTDLLCLAAILQAFTNSGPRSGEVTISPMDMDGRYQSKDYYTHTEQTKAFQGVRGAQLPAVCGVGWGDGVRRGEAGQPATVQAAVMVAGVCGVRPTRCLRCAAPRWCAGVGGDQAAAGPAAGAH